MVTVHAYDKRRIRSVSYPVQSKMEEWAVRWNLRRLGWTTVEVERPNGLIARFSRWCQTGLRESGGGNAGGAGVPVP